jgi:hypothetical protein
VLLLEYFGTMRLGGGGEDGLLAVVSHVMEIVLGSLRE